MKRHANSIGTRQCECGHIADIRQSTKKGRYLYSSCGRPGPLEDGCGLNQATKPYYQNLWWHTTEFHSEVDVVKPSNIVEGWKPKGSEKSTEPVSEVVTEQASETEQSSPDLSLDDIEQEATETVASEPKPKQKNGLLKILSILLLGGGFVGAIWASV